MKVVWSPLAIDRVAEIASYIAQDKFVAAEKWIRSAFGKVARLTQFAHSGRHVRETPRVDIRELIFGNYRIIYRIRSREVAILTVRHTKQILPLEEII